MRKNYIYKSKDEWFIMVTIRCKVPLITVCVMQGLLRGFVFALVFLIIHVTIWLAAIKGSIQA